MEGVNIMSNPRLLVIVLTIVLCMAIIIPAGCAPQSAPAASPAAAPVTPEGPLTLKIGSIWPLSGPGAQWGLPFKNVIQYQADTYNAAGGIAVGGKKYKLEIIHEDTKYVPTEARSAAEKLVNQDKVKYILGPLGGGEMNAIKSLLNENKVINLEVNNSIDCVGPDKPYTFRPFVGIGELSYALLKYFKDNQGIKTYQAVLDDTESARSGFVDDQTSCITLGLTVLPPEYFPSDTKDFFPVMTKILANNPDIIGIGGGPGAQALQLKALRSLGYKGIVYTSTPTPAIALLFVVPKDFVEGYYNTALIMDGDMALPGVIQFRKDWAAAGKSWVDAGPLGVGAANFLPLLVQGIQAAGTVDDTDKVKTALENLKYDSPIFGICQWGGMERYGNNHVLLYPVNINIVKDGKEVGVAVIQAKDLKPVVRQK
jgi:branched-chain amino acid transport system substrate-binding protein